MDSVAASAYTDEFCGLNVFLLLILRCKRGGKEDPRRAKFPPRAELSCVLVTIPNIQSFMVIPWPSICWSSYHSFHPTPKYDRNDRCASMLLVDVGPLPPALGGSAFLIRSS